MKLKTVLIFGLLLVTGATRVSAQTVRTAPADPSRPGPFFTIDTSTTPMTRNVVMGETGYAAFARALDWGFDAATRHTIYPRSGGAIAIRIGRFAFVDIWVAQYLFAWTHEYGHKTRINEAGVPASVIIGGSPWSLNAHTDATFTGTSIAPGMFSAGMEATTVVARRVERRMAFDGTAHYTDLTALFIANAMAFGYIQHDLSAGRVSAGFTLTGPSPADPSGYAVTLAERRLQRDPTLAERQAVAADIRHGSWLNLLDYNLINVGAGLFHDYLWRGERQTSVRWMRAGSLYFIPSLRYELTPIGPERQLRSFVRSGRARLLAYIRWSERVNAGRLTGAGTDYMFPRAGRWRPSLAVDVWRNPNGAMASRLQGAVEWFGPGDQWRVEGAIGGKARGYLLGFPDKAGAYLNAGVALKF